MLKNEKTFIIIGVLHTCTLLSRSIPLALVAKALPYIGTLHTRAAGDYSVAEQESNRGLSPTASPYPHLHSRQQTACIGAFSQGPMTLLSSPMGRYY